MTPKIRAWTEEGKVMYYDAYTFKDNTLLLSYDGISFDEVPASDFILMQSTGLFDKNGEEIFEGDVVKIPDDYDTFGHNAGEILKVAFDSGCFRLKRPNSKGRGFYFEDDNTVTIIGNIYENPELLGGK